MKWLKNIYLSFVAMLQEFRRDIKESAELTDLRRKYEGLKQINTVLTNQILILQKLQAVRDINKKQDEVLMKMNEHLAALKQQRHSEHPGRNQSIRNNRATDAGAAIHKTVGNKLNGLELNFMHMDEIDFTNDNEVRPKLFYHIVAAKDSIKSILSGAEIMSSDMADDLLNGLTMQFIGNNKAITVDQRFEVRTYIKRMIGARARFKGPWTIKVEEYDIEPGKQKTYTEEIMLIPCPQPSSGQTCPICDEMITSSTRCHDCGQGLI